MTLRNPRHVRIHRIKNIGTAMPATLLTFLFVLRPDLAAGRRFFAAATVVVFLLTGFFFAAINDLVPALLGRGCSSILQLFNDLVRKAGNASRA